MQRSPRTVCVALVAVAAIALTAAAPAGARAIQALPEWPALLPPLPGDSSGTVPLGFDVCPAGGPECPPDVIDEMTRRWEPLDAACDHRAVFALTYLRTTQEFFRTETDDPSYFSDVPWINHEDAVFAELYFRAYDGYVAGDRVPAAWRIAFDTAKASNETAIGDLLLGMNAHINRDLPFTLAAVGLVKPDGSSRKSDHDKVNAFLDRVIDPLQEELAQRYDPLFATTDAEPSPFDETAALALVRGFRENAWRNAERLVNARTEAQRRQVAASIELEAATGAKLIRATNTLPGYGKRRDAYCQAAH
jgi:hypothetical protein